MAALEQHKSEVQKNTAREAAKTRGARVATFSPRPRTAAAFFWREEKNRSITSFHAFPHSSGACSSRAQPRTASTAQLSSSSVEMPIKPLLLHEQFYSLATHCSSCTDDYSAMKAERVVQKGKACKRGEKFSKLSDKGQACFS